MSSGTLVVRRATSGLNAVERGGRVILDRFASTKTNVIPHIIHQVWVGSNDPPPHLQEYVESWRRHHADWEIKLWQQDEHERILQEYPQYQATYEGFPYVVQKADLIRVLYLHKHGGLYVDLDFECRKPFDPLFEEPRLIFGRETAGLGEVLNGENYVASSLMASPANHQFWLQLADQIKKAHRPQRWFEPREIYIVRTTGPELLTHALGDYMRHNDDVEIFSYEVFYPAPQVIRDVEERRRLGAELDSYAIHHYEDAWFSPLMKLLTWLRYVWFRIRRALKSVFVPHKRNA